MFVELSLYLDDYVVVVIKSIGFEGFEEFNYLFLLLIDGYKFYCVCFRIWVLCVLKDGILLVSRNWIIKLLKICM